MYILIGNIHLKNSYSRPKPVSRFSTRHIIKQTVGILYKLHGLCCLRHLFCRHSRQPLCLTMTTAFYIAYRSHRGLYTPCRYKSFPINKPADFVQRNIKSKHAFRQRCCRLLIRNNRSLLASFLKCIQTSFSNKQLPQGFLFVFYPFSFCMA